MTSATYSNQENKEQKSTSEFLEKVNQTKAITLQDNRPSSVLQKKANNTGLPDNLKSGIENLSGHAMDDVKVHYNSDKPAQLNAHAYAQGSEIHLASGQEKHLPHEAWHIVQQKQGRVKPTMQMKGKVNVNDDAGLENEADVMGAKALQNKIKANSSNNTTSTNSLAIQRMLKIGGEPKKIGDLPADIAISSDVRMKLTGWGNLPAFIIDKSFATWQEAIEAASASAVSVATTVRPASTAVAGSSLTPLETTLVGHNNDYENIDSGSYVLFTPDELATRRLTVSGERVYRGGAIANLIGPDWLFIVSHDGNIYAEKGKKDVIHHSSLAGGKQPIAAGEINIKDGVIIQINEKSGHYMPPRGTAELVANLLKGKGFPVEDGAAQAFHGASLMVAPQRVSEVHTRVLAEKAQTLRLKQIAQLAHSREHASTTSPSFSAPTHTATAINEHGIDSIDHQLDFISLQLRDIEQRLARLQERLQQLSARLDQLGRDLDQLKIRIDALGKK